MAIELRPAAKDLLSQRLGPVFGARPLRRTIQREIEDSLSKKILFGEFQPGQIVIVDADRKGETAKSPSRVPSRTWCPTPRRGDGERAVVSKGSSVSSSSGHWAQDGGGTPPRSANPARPARTETGSTAFDRHGTRVSSVPTPPGSSHVPARSLVGIDPRPSLPPASMAFHVVHGPGRDLRTVSQPRQHAEGRTLARSGPDTLMIKPAQARAGGERPLPGPPPGSRVRGGDTSTIEQRSEPNHL